MKRFKIWSMILLAVMALPLMVSCGGDDDDSESTMVNGVNVNKGKKLVRLNIQYKYHGAAFDDKLRIEYDAKKRLSKVVLIYDSVYENKTWVKREIDLISIDYDLRIINCNYLKQSIFMFTLNKEGYVSQLNDYMLTYDSYGYLTGVDSRNYIWTLAYNEGELIKSLVQNISKNKLEAHYMFYGEDSNTGELLFIMNSPPDGSRDYWNMENTYGALCFIAYQSGLFGKITKHCSLLSNKDETNAVLQKTFNNVEKKYVFHAHFEFE